VPGHGWTTLVMFLFIAGTPGKLGEEQE